MPINFSGKIPKSQVVHCVNNEFNDKICVEQGDITQLEIDAIVNAGKHLIILAKLYLSDLYVITKHLTK